MKIGSKEYNDSFEEYRAGRAWLSDVTMEIIGEPNELDPMVLLRAYEADATPDTNLALASQMFINKELRFQRGNVEVARVAYSGGDLSAKFAKFPWLLDVMFRAAYSIMLKKLTPPSESSAIEGQA